MKTTSRLTVRLTDDLKDAIDIMASKNHCSRSFIMKRLMRIGLKAVQARKKAA